MVLGGVVGQLAVCHGLDLHFEVLLIQDFGVRVVVAQAQRCIVDFFLVTDFI